MVFLRHLPFLLFLSVAARSGAFTSRQERAPSLVAVRGVPFFADDVVLSPLPGDAPALRESAAFMVDSFWLRSPQGLVVDAEDPTGIADGARASLVAAQADDLARKYGERMGARRLRSRLISAVDRDGLLGLVGVETTLLDRESMEVLSAERAEARLTDCVASLGPKQRREYKSSTAAELAEMLLPASLDLIVVLSNLAVAPRARRRGVAAALCGEVERTSREDWAFGEIYLQVEDGNAAARGLYEGKLGYERVASRAAVGLRVDAKKGTFEEMPAETLLLTKKL